MLKTANILFSIFTILAIKNLDYIVNNVKRATAEINKGRKKPPTDDSLLIEVKVQIVRHASEL